MSATEKTAAALCRLLTKGDEADRCHALRALGALRHAGSVPALVERLYDSDPDVCIDAAGALGRISDPAAIPHLLELLHNHPEGEVRSCVIEALGCFTDPQVETALLNTAAQRPDNLICDDEWDDWWDMQLHAVTALGQGRSAKAVPVLRAILEDEESQGIETELLNSLARIGGEGVAVLKQRLLHGSTQERRRAATALGLAKDPEAHPLLGEALLDREAEVRSAAIQALAAAGACGYLKAILLSLRDPNATVRCAAVESCVRLAVLGEQESNLACHLLPLLDDSNTMVRSTTIDTLDTLDERQLAVCGTRERITLCLRDANEQVAAAACRFVAHHRVSEARIDLLQIANHRMASAYLRQQAIHALGRLHEPDRRTIDTLHRATRDREQSVQLEALGALTTLSTGATPQAEYALQAVLEAACRPSPPAPQTGHPATAAPPSRQPEPRPAPVSTLEAIGMAQTHNTAPPGTGNPEEICEHPEQKEQVEAPAAPRREQHDPAVPLRILAIRALADCDREEALTALIDALQDDSAAVRREAASSIGHIAARCPKYTALRQAVGPLLSQLELGEEEMRHTCARTLARLGSATALPHLDGALEDRSRQVRIEAIGGVVVLATAHGSTQQTIGGIIRRLQSRLDDSASGVRLAAARGLAELLPLAGANPPVRQVVERIIAAARIDHGSHARQMGRILREIDREAAAETLLRQLETMESSGERRFVIELLEELLAEEEAGEAPA